MYGSDFLIYMFFCSSLLLEVDDSQKFSILLYGITG
jgi:hypothetical protein